MSHDIELTQMNAFAARLGGVGLAAVGGVSDSLVVEGEEVDAPAVLIDEALESLLEFGDCHRIAMSFVVGELTIHARQETKVLAPMLTNLDPSLQHETDLAIVPEKFLCGRRSDAVAVWPEILQHLVAFVVNMTANAALGSIEPARLYGV